MNELSPDESQYGSNNQFDIKEYLLRLLRLWPLGLASFLICMAGAIFFLKYKTPQYHINAKLLIDDEKKTGASDITDMLDLGGLLGGKSSVDNEAEVLQTRFLMESLVREMDLNVIWYVKNAFKDAELANPPYELKIEQQADSIMATKFDFVQLNNSRFSLDYSDPITNKSIHKEVGFGQPFELTGFGLFRLNRLNNSPKGDEFPFSLVLTSVDSRVASLRDNLTIGVTNKLASTIDITFDYPVPSKGEKILSNYIQEYIRQNIKDKSRIADSTIAFIDDRILLVNAELDGIEGKIQGFKQTKGLADITEQGRILVTTTSEYVKQLAEIETRIQMLDAIGQQLAKDTTESRIVAGSVLASDVTFNELTSKYNALFLQRERLLLSYTPNNPFVENVDKQIASVREDILAYIKSARGTLEVSKTEAEKNAGTLQGNIRDVPAQERAFLDLSRQQQIKQELYVFLLQKREETAVTKTSNIAGIRIIDPSKADYKPYSPKKVVILAIALIFSMAIPLGWLYLQDLLDTTVQSRRDVEKRTKVPIVGEISHNDGVEEVPFNASRSAIAEQFRGLRTNLQFLLGNGNSKVILVSSGQPGEGKSFISLNLARVYAVSGKRVLLLEFDLRKPKLSATFDTYGHTGITNYLVNPEMDYKEMLITSDVVSGQLYFAPSGPIPPNPSELILNGRLEKFFEEIRKDFDFIIVDAPPVGAVTDAQLLSEYSDVCLYLVRCGVTPHEVLNIPEDLRINQKIKNIGIVLNDISEHAPGYYGYGYYHNEEDSKPWWQRWFAKMIKRR